MADKKTKPDDQQPQGQAQQGQKKPQGQQQRKPDQQQDQDKDRDRMGQQESQDRDRMGEQGGQPSEEEPADITKGVTEDVEEKAEDEDLYEDEKITQRTPQPGRDTEEPQKP